MGFTLKIADWKSLTREKAKTDLPKAKVLLDETSITSVEFLSSTPDETNARSTNQSLSVKITGKMNYSLGAKVEDKLLKITEWAGRRAEDPKSYQGVVIGVVAAGQTVRQYAMPDAFIVEYTEEMNEEQGVGTFFLHIRQKKDVNKNFDISGGFEFKAEK